jgi:hypothetical protein
LCVQRGAKLGLRRATRFQRSLRRLRCNRTTGLAPCILLMRVNRYASAISLHGGARHRPLLRRQPQTSCRCREGGAHSRTSFRLVSSHARSLPDTSAFSRCSAGVRPRLRSVSGSQVSFGFGDARICGVTCGAPLVSLEDCSGLESGRSFSSQAAVEGSGLRRVERGSLRCVPGTCRVRAGCVPGAC